MASHCGWALFFVGVRAARRSGNSNALMCTDVYGCLGPPWTGPDPACGPGGARSLDAAQPAANSKGVCDTRGRHTGARADATPVKELTRHWPYQAAPCHRPGPKPGTRRLNNAVGSLSLTRGVVSVGYEAPALASSRRPSPPSRPGAWHPATLSPRCEVRMARKMRG